MALRSSRTKAPVSQGARKVGGGASAGSNGRAARIAGLWQCSSAKRPGRPQRPEGVEPRVVGKQLLKQPKLLLRERQRRQASSSRRGTRDAAIQPGRRRDRPRRAGPRGRSRYSAGRRGGHAGGPPGETCAGAPLPAPLPGSPNVIRRCEIRCRPASRCAMPSDPLGAKASHGLGVRRIACAAPPSKRGVDQR
jgi:hypothetical protein